MTTMRKIMLLSIILMSLNSSAGVEGDMKVKIRNIYPVSGELYIALYSSQGSYMNPDSALARSIITVESDSMMVSFPGVREGTYAIAVFQDLNANGTFDANEFGIPTEPFGFSNDSKGLFGPPDFEKASFRFLPGEEVTISLVNQPPGKVRPVNENDPQKVKQDKEKKCRASKKETKPPQ